MSLKKLFFFTMLIIAVTNISNCSSNGFFGSGMKSDLTQYKICKTKNIGEGSLSDGIGLAAIARTPEDPRYGSPHFYIAIRADGISNSKIVIFDIDTGKPIEQLIIKDK